MSEPTPADLAGITDPRMAQAFNATRKSPPPPAPIRTLGDYLDFEIPVPPQLVSPCYLIRGGITVIVAEAGKGKTSLLLNRVIPFACGKSAHEGLYEFKPENNEPLKTLIIENEGAGGMFQRKIRAMLEGSGRRYTEHDLELVKENVLIWGEGGFAGIYLDDPDKLEQVEEGLAKWKPDIVMMEPFARLWQGDENSNTEANKMLSLLERVARDHGCAIILAHHKKKGGVADPDDLIELARGASALGGAVTYMEMVRNGPNDTKTVACAKNRYDQQPKPFDIKWREDNSGWYDYALAKAEGVQYVINVLPYQGHKALTIHEVMDTLDEAPTAAKSRTVKGWLKEAEIAGEVVTTRNPDNQIAYYRAGDDGEGEVAMKREID